MTLVVASTEQMEALGRKLALVARAGDVIVLTGELGAGKTTFARGFGQALGLVYPVSSPTFVVARTHQAEKPQGTPLVHIDAYRLGSAGELDDLDIDVAGSIVLAEWAAPYAHVLAPDWLEITLERPVGGDLEDIEADEPRVVSFAIHSHTPDIFHRFLDAAGVR